MALKLGVDWQASPPKYQVFAACILEGDDVKGGAHDLVSTDSWITFCKTSFHLVIKPDGAGFVELGVAVVCAQRLTNYFNANKRRWSSRRYLRMLVTAATREYDFTWQWAQGGRDNQYAGYAMYESDCNGNLLRKDPRALPDDFFSLEAKKKKVGWDDLMP